MQLGMVNDGYLFCFCIGDLAGDGHNIHREYILWSNKPVAYVAAVTSNICILTGVPLLQLCRDYQESTIPAIVVDRLRELGVYLDDFEIFEGELVYVEGEEYIRLWMRILRILDSSLDIQLVDIPYLNNLISEYNVGYGIYE